MSKFSKVTLSIILLSLICAKHLIPSNGSSVVLEGENKEYIYYKFGKDGLIFNSIDKGFSKDDSVRVKLFFRSIASELEKDELIKVKLQKTLLGSNGNADKKIKKNLKYVKERSNLKIKNRPGWKVSKAGLWYVDVSVDDFKNIIITSKNKVIVKASIEKISRQKYPTVKSLSMLNKETRYTIDTKKFDEKTNKTRKKSSYWYKIDDKDDELQFEVSGPTSIRVFTRLAQPSESIEENNYTLFIKEDGIDIGTYLFKGESSGISHIKSSGEKVGKWRTCWVTVPSGKHHYTLKSGGLSDKTIYIKVKKYDK